MRADTDLSALLQDHITIAEASMRLGITYHATLARIYKGEIVGAKVGSSWLVSPASVEKAARRRATSRRAAS